MGNVDLHIYTQVPDNAELKVVSGCH